MFANMRLRNDTNQENHNSEFEKLRFEFQPFVGRQKIVSTMYKESCVICRSICGIEMYKKQIQNKRITG